MKNMNAFATGRKVYGNGSHAPTRGQVSGKGAQGYLQREIRNRAVSKVGGDGQSDTRSGVAKAALGRKMGAAPSAKPKGNTGSPVSNGALTTGSTPQPQVGGNGQAVANPMSGAPVGVGTTVPEMNVSPSGTIELPYNANFGAAGLAALQESNAALLELQQADQAYELEYNNSVADQAKAYQNQQRGTLNGNAGNGTLFSSAYSTQMGNDTAANTDVLNKLSSSRSLYQQQSAAQKLAIQDAFRQQLASGALTMADETDDAAGALGYGTAGQRVSKAGGLKKKSSGGGGGSAKKAAPKATHKPKGSAPSAAPKKTTAGAKASMKKGK